MKIKCGMIWMKSRKAVRSDKLPVKAWKAMGKIKLNG